MHSLLLAVVSTVLAHVGSAGVKKALDGTPGRSGLTQLLMASGAIILLGTAAALGRVKK